jgi:hypothetical protein
MLYELFIIGLWGSIANGCGQHGIRWFVMCVECL